MADGKEAAGREDSKAQRRAILFELEHVVVGGRAIKFGLLKAALKSHRVELTDALYSRYALHRVPREGLGVLLADAGKSGLADVLQRYETGLIEEFSSPKLKLTENGETIVKVARKHHTRVGALSSLNAATTETLLKTLELNTLGAATFVISAEDTREYSSDHWLHLARKADTTPRRCVAVCTQSDAGRAAMAARMRCVALPDRFTSCQDFGGADYVGETLTATALEHALGDHGGK